MSLIPLLRHRFAGYADQEIEPNIFWIDTGAVTSFIEHNRITQKNINFNNSTIYTVDSRFTEGFDYTGIELHKMLSTGAFEPLIGSLKMINHRVREHQLSTTSAGHYKSCFDQIKYYLCTRLLRHELIDLVFATEEPANPAAKRRISV